MGHLITTWFYVQSKDEGGAYAQLSGDPSTEKFRDVYRRCLAVFFQSARMANPDADLILYLNEPWNPAASRVASKVANVMQDLNVEIRIIKYGHCPPATFVKSWRNQFFVLDVLDDLAGLMKPSDTGLVLDSDIIWSGRSTEEMWNTLRREGISTYKLGYSSSNVVNGLSMDTLAELGRSSGIIQNAELAYSGGEFVGGNGMRLRELSDSAHHAWQALMGHHTDDPTVQFEEAHLLSVAYSTLGVDPGGMNNFVRRLWTQPFKFRNVGPEDISLALWHVPAEKKYGIRRLYKAMFSKSNNKYSYINQEKWNKVCLRQIGIPRNTLVKTSQDLVYAVCFRIWDKLSQKPERFNPIFGNDLTSKRKHASN